MSRSGFRHSSERSLKDDIACNAVHLELASEGLARPGKAQFYLPWAGLVELSSSLWHCADLSQSS